MGQRRVRQFVGQILLAGIEPHERSALLRDMIADRPAQHGIAGLEGVKDRSERGLPHDLDLHLAVDMGQRSQVCRELDPNHGSVWTSTDNTAGRSRTIGAQLSPSSADAYTCPPVVPKYSPGDSSESMAEASRSTFTKQLLCGNPLVSASHSLPPVRLRKTRSFPSGGTCSESLL